MCHEVSLSVVVMLRTVGNLPFDITEQALTDLFSTAGPVKSMRYAYEIASASHRPALLWCSVLKLCTHVMSICMYACLLLRIIVVIKVYLVPFRLVTDRETGRFKGFGFCEFYDVATAESAFRNLSGHDINGRSIRIDFAEDFQTKGGREKGQCTAVSVPASAEYVQHATVQPVSLQ